LQGNAGARYFRRFPAVKLQLNFAGIFHYFLFLNLKKGSFGFIVSLEFNKTPI
jgi:hypothetical protein